jgi:serine phosphatase RsbU (regulator of sigma subunit)
VVEVKDVSARHRRAPAPLVAGPPAARRGPRRARLPLRPGAPAIAVLVIGLLMTGALSWTAHVSDRHTETRLLNLQVRQTGALLQAVLPTIQTPLASAAEIAATSQGDAAGFRSYLSDYMGTKKLFASAVLWKVTGSNRQVVTSLGAPTALPATSARAADLVAAALDSSELQAVGPIAGNPYRLGYAFASAGAAPRYVVYAEGLLPPQRRVTVQKGSPFGNLRFALYLGTAPSGDRLLESNAALPLPGPTATMVIPFGGASLTIVAGSSSQLGGSISRSLWWIIAVAGTALTVGAALTAQRLVRRRRAAEHLTADVRTLLSEQRTIAEQLQHALLPSRLPEVPTMSITARYVPGADGVQIGGDWYDVLPLEGERLFFVVGDVSGRGVEAGAVMASLLFASRGFASEGHAPDQVLDALARLLDVRRDKHFATVLCGIADLARGELTVASAGHLPPLLVSADRTEYMAVPTGPPIGVPNPAEYSSVTVPIPSGATLLAYTDGLIERRDETLDDGLRRLMDVASSAGSGGAALVDHVMATLVTDDCDDDTAVLGLGWQA